LLCSLSSTLLHELFDTRSTSRPPGNSETVHSDHEKHHLAYSVLNALGKVVVNASRLSRMGHLISSDTNAASTELVHVLSTDVSLKDQLHAFARVFNQGKTHGLMKHMEKSYDSLRSKVGMPVDFLNYFAIHVLKVNGLVPSLIGEVLSAPDSLLISDTLATLCNSLPSAGELIQCHIDSEKGNTSELKDSAFVILLDFEYSLRAFLRSCMLPKEGQKIERLVEPFCVSWYKKGCVLYDQYSPKIDFRSYFPSSDAAFLLAFSLLMLNTELHSRVLNVSQRKASGAEATCLFQPFFSRLQHVDGLKNFTEDALFQVFNRIWKTEFRRWIDSFSKDESDHCDRSPIPIIASRCFEINDINVSDIDTFARNTLELLHEKEPDCDSMNADLVNETIDVASRHACAPSYTGTMLGTYMTELLSLSSILKRDLSAFIEKFVVSDRIMCATYQRHDFPLLFAVSFDLQNLIKKIYEIDDTSKSPEKITRLWLMFHKHVSTELLERKLICCQSKFFEVVQSEVTSGQSRYNPFNQDGLKAETTVPLNEDSIYSKTHFFVRICATIIQSVRKCSLLLCRASQDAVPVEFVQVAKNLLEGILESICSLGHQESSW